METTRVTSLADLLVAGDDVIAHAEHEEHEEHSEREECDEAQAGVESQVSQPSRRVRGRAEQRARSGHSEQDDARDGEEPIDASVYEEVTRAAGSRGAHGGVGSKVPSTGDSRRNEGADDVLVLVGGTIPAPDAESLREQQSHHVDTAAGCHRNHNLHRSVGIFGPRRGCARQQDQAHQR